MFKFSRSRFKPGRRGVITTVLMAFAVIAALPGVSGALTSGEEYADSSFTLGEVTAEIGADALYEQGYTGKGVTVAVIDTGVEPVVGLDGQDKVIYGPDLSFESGVEELYNHDTFGHGTVMASIIAGNDEADADGFRGVAPGAQILSVKVADNTGAVDVSQVIAAIDFVIETKDDTGVRVINLAYSTDGGEDPATDPLVHAVERAWDAGIVVVVSAGNSGRSSGALSNPALSPYVISVAAADETNNNTEYSSTGDAERRPDILAPGSRVVGLASPYSRLVQENPDALLGDRFLRGSGTSQASAVVSGSVALLLEQRPELTPDQVKALLLASSSDIWRPEDPALEGTLAYGLYVPSDKLAAKNRVKDLGSDPADVADYVSSTWTGKSFSDVDFQHWSGIGRVALDRAAGFPTVDLEQRHAKSDGTGSLDDARGSVFVTLPDGSILSGNKTFTGSSWSGSSWSGSSWSGSSWSGSSWSGSSWSGSSWSGSSWSGSSWSGSSWSGSSWSGSSWSGSAWSGIQWG